MSATDANWPEVVEKASHVQPVIVDFTASWCGPCRVLGPVLEQAVRDAGGVTLAAYDIDESSERAEEFRVSAYVPLLPLLPVLSLLSPSSRCCSVPSVFAFSNGKKVAEFKGALPAPLVTQFVAQVKALHVQPPK